MASSKIPVTLVTGYLGSGKTTLVNRLLQQSKSRRLAVIVNEFGAVGIDGALLEGSGKAASVIELPNGCLCCVVNGEFFSSLQNLAASREKFDHIVVETSGAADPTMILKAFWGEPRITRQFQLDGVVCVVDSLHFLQTVQTEPVVALQAAVADVLCTSKAGQTTSERAKQISIELSEINAEALVLEANHDFLDERLMGIEAYRKPPSFKRSISSDLRTKHGLSSAAFSWEGKVELKALQKFFQTLVFKFDGKLVRTKALFNIDGEERPWLIQGVQNWIERSKGPRSYQGPNRLVILGHKLDAQELGEAVEKLKRSAVQGFDSL
ncbi:MAG: CobW family GTP-binding protein [Bdellovibrionota bacterium]